MYMFYQVYIIRGMSAWSRRRYTIYFITAITIIALALFAIYTFFIFEPATCFDGEQNGSEQAVDCGGSCERICPFQAVDPQIVWARAFEISDGVYNLGAIVRNPNFSARLEGQYKFEAFNNENLKIYEVFGDLELEPSQEKPIFEPTVLTGEQRIERVFLTIVEGFMWERAEPPVKDIVITSRTLSDAESVPKLRVSLNNTSLAPIRDIAVFAALYNADGNVVQSSRTFVEMIERDGEAEAFFTWPEAFKDEVTKIDVFTERIAL